MKHQELQKIQSLLGGILPFVEHKLSECSDEDCKCGLTTNIVEFVTYLSTAEASQ